MTPDDIQGLVRHLLTTLGGGLVANGYMTNADLQTAIGAVIALAGFAWSLYQKSQHRKALAAATKGQ